MQEKRIRPIFIVLLCAFISLLCGLGGAYFTITHLGGTSPIVYQSNENSNVSSVSSDGSHENTNTIRGAVEKAAPAVVEILTETEVTSYNLFGGTYVANNAGSGVILSEDGYIITNNHVVSDAKSIKVTTYDGKQYDAELIGKDKTSDIAVIKVEADNLTSATVGDSTKVQAGDIALVIGNPLGTLGGSVTDGIISAPSREITIDGEAMNLIQTDAEINSGNSGGGLFNGDGNLIGIVNAKDSGTTSSGATIEGIGFAIPINYALEIAEDLIENGVVVNRATIGVYLQELAKATEQYPAGLYITDIVKDSGAEKAGLQAYDRIVALDGTEINSYTELKRIMRDKKVGDKIILSIIRDGETVDYEITLTGTLDDK